MEKTFVGPDSFKDIQGRPQPRIGPPYRILKVVKNIPPFEKGDFIERNYLRISFKSFDGRFDHILLSKSLALHDLSSGCINPEEIADPDGPF